MPHPAALIRRTLEDGRGVLVLEPAGLAASDVRRLGLLARRSSTSLRFFRPRLAAETLELLRVQLRQDVEQGRSVSMTIDVSLDLDASSREALAAAEDGLLLLSDLVGKAPDVLTALGLIDPLGPAAAPFAALARFGQVAVGRVDVVGTDSKPRFTLSASTANSTASLICSIQGRRCSSWR